MRLFFINSLLLLETTHSWSKVLQTFWLRLLQESACLLVSSRPRRCCVITFHQNVRILWDDFVWLSAFVFFTSKFNNLLGWLLLLILLYRIRSRSGFHSLFLLLNELYLLWHLSLLFPLHCGHFFFNKANFIATWSSWVFAYTWQNNFAVSLLNQFPIFVFFIPENILVRRDRRSVWHHNGLQNLRLAPLNNFGLLCCPF